MRNANERAASALVDSVRDAVAQCEFLAITTGDDDFKLLAMFLQIGLTAKAKGDMLEFMEALAGLIDKRIQHGKDATADVIEDPRFTPSLN